MSESLVAAPKCVFFPQVRPLALCVAVSKSLILYDVDLAGILTNDCFSFLIGR